EGGGDVQPAGERLGGAWHAAHLRERLGWSEERLGRHARVIGAFATDEVVLDERDVQAAVGDAPRADLAGGSRADHDNVELALAHLEGRPSPAGRGSTRSRARGTSRTRPRRARRRGPDRRRRRALSSESGSRG